MSKLHIARRPKRRGLLIAKGSGIGNDNKMLLFPLDGLDSNELDELIRAILAQGGVTNEAEVQAVIDRAEEEVEIRIKVAEARAEIRRLMALRGQGLSLMQRGYRKWVEVFYPAITQFKKT